MQKMKLTKAMIEKLPFAEIGKQIEYYDSELDGFGIRVSHTGKKYFVRRFVGKKRVRVMIGSHPIKTAEEARSEARIKLGAMESGIDPNEQQRERVRLEAKKAKEITVKDLVNEYLKKHAVNKKSGAADERLLNVEVVPLWGKHKAEDIKKRDIVLLLESIVERGTPAMSNQVLKITRKMFNFAVERDILQHTPFTGVKALAPNVRRERTLTESEIKNLWGTIDNAAMSGEIKRSLKLVLVTAQRPGEVTGMHTNEINGQWWTIPKERAKNGREHRVFLSNHAQEIIAEAIAQAKATREVPADQEYSGYIFPCPHQAKEQPIDSHALPVAVRRNLEWPLTDKKGKPLYDKDGKPATENRLSVDKFTPHDLRRTAATFLGSMGFMDEIIDAVLNHAKTGIIRTYNRHDYDKEKKRAMEAWDRRLLGILTSTTQPNVICLVERERNK